MKPPSAFNSNNTQQSLQQDCAQRVQTSYYNKTVLRECKPRSRPKFQPKVIQDSNPDCQIKSDPDTNVYRISPEMLCIQYLVGVSHFAKFRKNQAVTVWEMLINLLKSRIPQLWRKGKHDPESVSGTGSPPKFNQFVRLIGAIKTPSFNEIGKSLFPLLQSDCWHCGPYNNNKIIIIENRHTWVHSPGGSAQWHFEKALIVLNWHVTLPLTVFHIFVFTESTF